MYISKKAFNNLKESLDASRESSLEITKMLVDLSKVLVQKEAIIDALKKQMQAYETMHSKGCHEKSSRPDQPADSLDGI